MNLIGLATVTTVLFAGGFHYRAEAGTEHGNGGGAVVCRGPNHEIKSIELLDFYEQREILQLNRDLGPTNTSYLEKIKYVLAHRKNFAPFRAKLWGSQADNFLNESVFLKGVKFNRLNDTGNIFIPEGCDFEQVAVQDEPLFTRQKRFKINQDLWDAMDDENRAGLVLHEIIYREAISYGHEDSIRSRYLNAIWTAAGDVQEFSSWQQINELLANAHFVAGEAYGCSPLLYENPDRFRDWTKRTKMSFYPNGQIEASSPNKYESTVSVPTPLGWLQLKCAPDPYYSDYSLFFNSDGMFALGGLQTGTLRVEQFDIRLDSAKSYYRDKSENRFSHPVEDLIELNGVSGAVECKGQSYNFKNGEGLIIVKRSTLKIEDCWAIKTNP